VDREPVRRVDVLRFLDFRGTFPPSLRAWERPIAIACLRLFTFFPERPLLSVPFFRSCIALRTLSDAFFPYLATVHSFRYPPDLDLLESRGSRSIMMQSNPDRYSDSPFF
jgi:hypothetical protein